MNLKFTYTRPGASRLILLFAGWGMSPRPLDDVSMPGYDVAVVWDYRDMSAPWLEELSGYEETVVVAWSFGVHAASRFMASHPGLRVTARIAVNGTRFTADDSRGIPRAIFDATLAGLSERSVIKFNMRMCGGAAAYKEFALRAPARSVDDLREELSAFDTCEAPRMLWDKACVSQDDMIIPAANQSEAWASDAVQTIVIDGPHLPDFNRLLRGCLTDKSHVEKRFRKAETTYDDNATAQYATAARLLDLAASHAPAAVGDILEAGCGTGRFTSMLLDWFGPARATLWDLHIAPQIEALRTSHPDIALTTLSCDAESEIARQPDEAFDMILSASTVQWFNSLRSFLTEASRTLRPGGVIALSTYGPDTMCEPRVALGTSGRFLSLEQISRCVPSSLSVAEITEERHTSLFGSPLEVLRHMSRTGVNGLSAGDSGDTAAGCRMLRNYPLDSEGKAPLTYHPIYLVLKKS